MVKNRDTKIIPKQTIVVVLSAGLQSLQTCIILMVS